MKEITLSGKKRAELGKKASKAIRKEGYVPANLYGEAKQDGKPVALSFAVPYTELRKAIYTPNVYIVNLNIEGEEHKAIIKEIQFHPTTDAPLHIDFLEVVDEKPITVGIPVKLVGLAQGVRDGGRMSLSVRKINVTAPYKQIPEVLNVDVTALTIGKSIKVGEVSFEGLDIATSKDVVICSIKMTRNAAAAAAAAASEE